MRAFVFPVVALLASMVSPDAHAQAKKAQGADAVRYFTFDSGLMDELVVDGILKETRQGGKVVSAVLDVCFPASDTSTRKDRFVVNLTVNGNKLVGSGQTQEDKEKVSVNLVRKQTGSNFSFEGSITVGSTESKASATELSDQSEQDYREGLPEDSQLVATPTDFTEVSPDSIAVKVKRDAVGALVKALRGQDVSVDFTSLAQDCAALRAGQNVVQIQVDPARAAAVLAKVKGLPGVTDAGYTGGGYSMDLAVRVPAAGFRGGDGKLDKDKLAAAIAASAEKALSAKLRSSKWDPTTGELTIELTRADETVAGVDLTEVVTVTAMVGPEKPGADPNLIVWLAETTSETVDGASQVKFTGAGGGGDEDSQTNEGANVADKLAEDLKGRTWDPDKSAWK